MIDATVNAARSLAEWIRDAFGLKPGELGDLYVAVKFASGVVIVVGATIIWIFQ